jgi:hypothetical protein
VDAGPLRFVVAEALADHLTCVHNCNEGRGGRFGKNLKLRDQRQYKYFSAPLYMYQARNDEAA